MRAGSDTVMWHQLFQLTPNGDTSLQRQLREQLVAAILDGRIPSEQPLPSSRELSRQLHVSRNTIVLAYEQLIDEGFLVARERRGYFVNTEILRGRVQSTAESDVDCERIDWEQRFAHRVSSYPNIEKPKDWRKFPFPFVYGQPDTDLIPINDWRECVRQSLVDKTCSLAQRQTIFIVIEDDYECETNYIGEPTPALKSLDKRGRVIYVSSLTKTFAPGLRLGFFGGRQSRGTRAARTAALDVSTPADQQPADGVLLFVVGAP
ncbi:HTH-type transcriptional regulator TauR-like [Oratosquilla oratoria]|uniref:HTH-type transcriptional regulator TauR-like n=1 Tax=Oratosquilla oratoria TaxID=337810 RepID=UPI003F7695DF